MDARDPERLAGEELRREVPERRDDLRPDQLDLPEEVPLAGLDLLGLRVAVAGRPALEHVRDVDVLARQPDPGEQLAEQLPGGADERHALLVLVESGRLADEHQVGVGEPEPNTTCVRVFASAQRVQPATASREREQGQVSPQPQLPPQQPPPLPTEAGLW